jgi:hypothetical protein
MFIQSIFWSERPSASHGRSFICIWVKQAKQTAIFLRVQGKVKKATFKFAVADHDISHVFFAMGSFLEIA